MGLFNKKANPISVRAKALNAEIASLESKVKKLAAELGQSQSPTRLGPPLDASDHSRINHSTPAQAVSRAPSPEPVFEDLGNHRPKSQPLLASTPPGCDSAGVWKPGLFGALERLRDKLRGPPPSNPKLVNYLAAGSIQGLPPLRYEKRVARYRLLLLCLLLVLVLWILIEIVRRY